MIKNLLKYRIGSLAKLSQQIPYPFQFTLNPSQFKFVDTRFEQYPINQKLYPNEYEHVRYVFTLFQKYLNKNQSEAATLQFIDKRLINKINQYRELMKQKQIVPRFNFNADQSSQSMGYLQYHGVIPNRYIHQYLIQRKDQKVVLLQKQELREIQKKTEQEQLKQDIEQINKQNSLGEKMKQKIFKKNSKHRQKIQKIMDEFTQGYLKMMQPAKFKPYYLVNRIKAKMNIQFQSTNSKLKVKQNVENLDVTTKWYYFIDRQEPQSIKNSRKRILFDFQLWNRGCLIPVKDFSKL